MQNSMFLVSFALVWVTASFYLFWPLFVSFLKTGNAKKIIIGRFYGFALFGLVPIFVCIVAGQDLGSNLGFAVPTGPVLWHIVSLVFVILLIPISYFQAKSSVNQKDYPQIRETNWTRRLIISNILSWMVYLIGYEILFRGLLIFPIEAEFGVFLALVINSGLYSITHMSKGFREALGSLPIGIILAVIAIKTQSILYPLIIHMVMAVSNSVFSIVHNPEMKIEHKS